MVQRTAALQSEYRQSSDEVDLHTEHMVLNVGPSHPATHGTTKFVLTLEGEKVVDVDVHVGYLHRGFEKMCEAGTWTQVLPYTDRLNYLSPLCNNVGYVLAVEKLIGVEAPERAQYIRALLCELSRITDHLTAVGAGALELGGFTPFLYALEAREMLYQLIETITGARLTTAYTRIGGLKSDLPDGFWQNWDEILPEIQRLFTDCDKLLTKNRVFYDRMMDTGIVSQADAISYGMTGIVLRSTGVAYDVRKDHPYLIYDRLDFEVPVGHKGDNYDRYLCRMEEIGQSIRMIQQIRAQIPEGPFVVGDWNIALPPKEEVYNSIEAMIAHFKIIMEGVPVPKGEVYGYTEAGNGELGFYIVSSGAGRPWKVHVRGPCFAAMSGLRQMIRGGLLADIIPTFDTINMVGGEIDR
jgi:NADH-quinone oxidoreductase subunit D